MIAYLIRRILYAIPILIGVNLLTFTLFFVINTPDDMAQVQLGIKRVTPEAIEKWKEQRGYNKPLLFNAQAAGMAKLTDTIFVQKSASMFVFDFGYSDDGRSISHEIYTRMLPSLVIALPTFIIGLMFYVTFALLMTLSRGTTLDVAGVTLCVFLMSISSLFYIIGGDGASSHSSFCWCSSHPRRGLRAGEHRSSSSFTCAPSRLKERGISLPKKSSSDLPSTRCGRCGMTPSRSLPG